MRAAGLAWRQLRRDIAAGDVRILAAALVLAVVAVTAVGFVTDRAERALALQANTLLGGDAVVRGDAPITGAIAEAAGAPGLRSTQRVELTTMVRAGGGEDSRLQMGELHALGAGYPLRGTIRLLAESGTEYDANGVPEPGTLWLGRAGAETLDARIGDTIGIGDARLRLAALVAQEPDAALDYFNVAPKVYLNLDDLDATGLVQEGSRLRYRLIVAGEANAVEGFVAVAWSELGRGQRLETVRDARPELRSALDRAGRFLGLAALVAVILAAVAVAMAARRHSERHLSGTAVMRCLGASQRTLVSVHVGELLMLGVIASAAGVAIAFLLQWALGAWLAQKLAIDIPAASVVPALQGLGVGLLVLLAFGAPPVLALRRVPALRVLRRDLDHREPSAWAVIALGLGGLAALLWWQSGSATLAVALLGGLAATFAVLALLAWLLIVLVRTLRTRLRGSLRYGLANVSRRPAASIAQVSAMGVGLMALLLLTFVRTDLLDRWQLALSETAPNRFIINVQDDQVDAVRKHLADAGIGAPELYPMVRARLVGMNGKAVTGADFEARGGRARRMAEREFNLSMADALRADNKVVAGAFWTTPPATPELSVEEEFANDLGWS